MNHNFFHKKKKQLAMMLCLIIPLYGFISRAETLSGTDMDVCAETDQYIDAEFCTDEGEDIHANIYSDMDAVTGGDTPLTAEDTPYADKDSLVSDQIYHVVVRGKLDTAVLIKSCIKDPTLRIDKYSVDNTRIASISKRGLLKGKREGLVLVTASVSSGGTRTTVGSILVQVSKPVFRFTKDLTYVGATLDANHFISNVPAGTTLSWSVPEISQPVLSVDPYTGKVTALRRGTMRVVCKIGDGSYAAKYTAALRVKPPRLKESYSIRVNRTKKITLSNVSSYTDVYWSLGAPAKGTLEITPTKRPNIVQIKALQSSPTPFTLTATVDGQKYTTTVTVK